MALQLLKASSQSMQVTGYKGISGGNPRTICFWVKGTFAINDQLFSWGTEASGQRWVLREQFLGGQNAINMTIFGSFMSWRIGSMFDGSEHWFCMDSVDSNRANINAFLDNAAMTFNSGGGAVAINTGNTNDVVVGDGYIAGSNNSNITIFDFRIYSRVLTAPERTAIFDDGNGCDIVTSQLQDKLRFEAESGVLVQETDLSGNGRDGFPVNAPVHVADPFSPCGGIIGSMLNNGMNEAINEGVN